MGFAEMDTSYESTGFVKAMMHMMAATLVASALAEVNLEMSLKTFTIYHWVLTPGILLWQLGPTATPFGKIMFALPHVFTLWTTIALLGGGGKSNTD